MAITYGDHLIDSGYHDITPEQEPEIWAREECARRGIDPDAECADGGTVAWMVVDQERRTPSPEREHLANALDPEMGFPSDYLLRCIHADIEIRGRKNSDFAVSVHHRNIVLSAVANALRRSSLLAWDEWLEHCGLSREAALNAALDSSKARDRALEEAAKLADEQCIQWVGINADRYWQSRRLAGSIRALKEPVEEAIITEAGRNALARDGGTK